MRSGEGGPSIAGSRESDGEDVPVLVTLETISFLKVFLVEALWGGDEVKLNIVESRPVVLSAQQEGLVSGVCLDKLCGGAGETQQHILTPLGKIMYAGLSRAGSTRR